MNTCKALWKRNNIHNSANIANYKQLRKLPTCCACRSTGTLSLLLAIQTEKTQHVVLFACSSCIKAPDAPPHAFICSHRRTNNKMLVLQPSTWPTQLLVCANRLEFRDIKSTIPCEPLLLVVYIKPAWMNNWWWRGLVVAALMAFAATSKRQKTCARYHKANMYEQWSWHCETNTDSHSLILLHSTFPLPCSTTVLSTFWLGLIQVRASIKGGLLWLTQTD